MAIRKCEDGRWLVDVRPNGAYGRRIRKIFPSQTKARDYEKYILLHCHNKPWESRAADIRLLSDLANLWMEFIGRSEEYGEQSFMRMMKVIREMGDPRICNITRAMLMEYRADKLGCGLSPLTVNRDLSVISGMFRGLIECGMYHGENPLSGLRKLKAPNKAMSFLGDDEVNHLLNIAKGDCLALAVLCLSTGARYGESSTLRRENIVSNKVMFTETKNGRARAVPVSDDVLELVTRGKKGQLFDVDYLEFREVIKSVKPDLPKGQATHVLRHTFATHFMMNGGNIITLQRILGHASIQQTMVYAHFAPDFLTEAIRFNPLGGKASLSPSAGGGE
ncbi:tyrosine-type recombinase/integrase [Escherichia coli]|uniref:phage integrase n=1 Tax=Escherichia coli TaxID=562 RepID=UPI000BE811B9|nr:tyrosine-type recombinase/integrase [Escherichia coli]EEU3019457.1 tyrosine-type recombinase/integrase [Escherichia coli]EEX5383263.1 tyrosine-type recombinase/integrase [Escherichia coli]EFE9119538.1 tyrosine-type recombinase/integrase [Escherichia coli]EFK6851205.1 tyrosine-type recombinase/integrase [Escherichia coli]EFL3920743.1 tyrosine-type recombinase/integrase [Escherichia coli]